MFKIGAGYNPGFTISEASRFSLPFPDHVSLIEFGPEDLLCFSSVIEELIKDRELQSSLHIARSPISEEDVSQDRFIDKLLKITYGKLFESVGFHLIGPRMSNIGRYGFSPAYDPCEKEQEDCAIKFIKKVQDILKKEVWIENTNFYSPYHKSPLELWSSMRRICEQTGAKIILDLAHYLIDCWNCGAPAEFLLGAIPWQDVKEIHLSGIIQSKDGSFHDGHSQPVHTSQWSILEKIIPFFIPNISDTYITIEHTEKSWFSNKNAFFSDFNRLSEIKWKTIEGKSPTSPSFQRREQYAKSRLKKLLSVKLPYVYNACLKNNLSFDAAFNEWIQFAIKEHDCRLVFSDFENEEGITLHSVRNFEAFFKARYSQCL